MEKYDSLQSMSNTANVKIFWNHTKQFCRLSRGKKKSWPAALQLLYWPESLCLSSALWYGPFLWPPHSRELLLFSFFFLNLWTHKEPLLPAQKTLHLNLIQHTWGEQWLNEMFDGKKNWSVVLLNSEVQNQKYLYKKMPRGEQQSWVCMQNKKSP